MSSTKMLIFLKYQNFCRGHYNPRPICNLHLDEIQIVWGFPSTNIDTILPNRVLNQQPYSHVHWVIPLDHTQLAHQNVIFMPCITSCTNCKAYLLSTLIYGIAKQCEFCWHFHMHLIVKNYHLELIYFLHHFVN